MTMQDHLGAGPHSTEVQQCIAVCRDTHRRSVEAIAHCHGLGGAHATPPYMKLLHDTVQITVTTADLLEQHARGAAHTCAVCAEITHQAAQATEGLAPDTLLQAYIRQCRACATVCRHLAQLTDELGNT